MEYQNGIVQDIGNPVTANRHLSPAMLARDSHQIIEWLHQLFL